MRSDIEIAREANMKPITEVAASVGIEPQELELYGNYMAKLSDGLAKRLESEKNGKLVLVTAINPTPAGEGKTTTSIGLAQAMQLIGKKAVLALREPSMGPVFGIKGGAAGGGYAQVVPMENINLHFTGDMHAITAANNLLCAVIDNHIQQGNKLNIDPRRIIVKRAMDMNDRALRFTNIGLGGKANGVPREDGFMITVATEIMAILCLAEDLQDLKRRFARILIGYTYAGEPVYCEDLKVHGAMAAIMKEAMKPNLVQTLENTPCVMHGGPFANIAHGCNSVRATKLALKLGDYCITEAGFGADLGAEKFLDIKCRLAGLKPDGVVLVATVRALKYNGGVKKEDLNAPNVEALKQGIGNLEKHIENMKKFGLNLVVALNAFPTDTDEEVAFIKETCNKHGVECTVSSVFAQGGKGGVELAKLVVDLCEKGSNFKPIYEDGLSITEKIETIAREIYGAGRVDYEPKAKASLAEIEKLGVQGLPVCVAKTQYSLSDDPKKLGRPEGFTVTVRNVTLSRGAGFVVALMGEIMTMPGLPKVPVAEIIDIDADGQIVGLS